MNRTIFICLVFIAMLVPCGSAYAQYSVRGHVISSQTGQPIPGVDVYISELNVGTLTGSDGAFFINGLPKGQFTVEFSYIGYNTETRKIDLSRNASPIIHVVMKKTTYESQPVVVLGNRYEPIKDTPLPVNVVRQQKVIMDGNASLWQSLSRLNGITVTTNGPGIERPVIRGLTSDRVMILEQDIPYAYQTWDHESGLSMTGNGSEQVQVIKGPATLLYGPGAMGGAINMIGERPAPVGQTLGDITLKGFSNTSGLSADLKIKGTHRGTFWGMRGGFGSNADYTDGRNKDVRNSRYNNAEGEAFGGITRRWGLVKLTYHFRQHKNGIVETGDEGNSGNENSRKIEPPYHKLDDHSLIAETKIISGNGWITGKLAFQRNRQQEIEPPKDSTGSAEAGMDLTLNTFTYRVGYEHRLWNLFDLNTGIQGNFQGNISEGGEPFVPGAAMNQEGAYALLDWSEGNIRWQAGIRYDFNHLSTSPAIAEDSAAIRSFGIKDDITRNFHNLSWSVGGTWQLNSHFSIKSNAAIGYRIPNLAELTADGILREQNRYLVGDNNLAAERNIEWDTSTRWESPNVTFSTDIYYNWISNFIYAEKKSRYFYEPTPPNPPTPIPIYRYRQRAARLYGGETDIALHPVNLPWFYLQSGFSMTVGYFDRSIQDAVPRMPAHTWRNRLKINIGNIGRLKDNYLALNITYTFSQNRVAGFETPTPGYTLTDLGLGTMIPLGSSEVEVSLYAHNLFNVSYYSHLSYLKDENIFNMGRNLSLTIHLPFLVSGS